MRCVHESQLWTDNISLTLTYDDDHLPDNYSVNVRDFQLFMKRLRKHYSGKSIRFFHCGEYGDQTLRPHYHALLFNHDFEDKIVHSNSKTGHLLYTSEILTSIWQNGHALIGDCTFESAAYVARYITKKITGDRSIEHYTRVHPITGEIHQVEPEYITMSRRPGIGSGWVSKYKSDIFPSDTVVINNHRVRPPKFYDKHLEEKELELVKKQRIRYSRQKSADNTKRRLRDREFVQQIRMKLLKRNGV